MDNLSNRASDINECPRSEEEGDAAPLLLPEVEYVDRTTEAIRYLEHGWPTDLCRWHSHPEYELHLVLCTHGTAFIGDYAGAFQPGSLFLIGPSVPHNWVTDTAAQNGEIETRDMLVQFGQESIEHLRSAFPEFDALAAMLELASSGIEFIDFDPVSARLQLEAIRDGRGPERILALLRFLVCINDHAEKKTLSIVNTGQLKNSNKQAHIANVVDHIIQNFSERISLEVAAELAGMSPSAFCRNFQKVMGSTFVAFVNRVRIGEACSRLYTTDEQISVICYDVGFQNLANFNRTFMKMKNMTPTAYRELARCELTPRKDQE